MLVLVLKAAKWRKTWEIAVVVLNASLVLLISYDEANGAARYVQDPQPLFRAGHGDNEEIPDRVVQVTS